MLLKIFEAETTNLNDVGRNARMLTVVWSGYTEDCDKFACKNFEIFNRPIPEEKSKAHSSRTYQPYGKRLIYIFLIPEW